MKRDETLTEEPPTDDSGLSQPITELVTQYQLLPSAGWTVAAATGAGYIAGRFAATTFYGTFGVGPASVGITESDYLVLAAMLAPFLALGGWLGWRYANKRVGGATSVTLIDFQFGPWLILTSALLIVSGPRGGPLLDALSPVVAAVLAGALIGVMGGVVRSSVASLVSGAEILSDLYDVSTSIDAAEVAYAEYAGQPRGPLLRLYWRRKAVVAFKNARKALVAVPVARNPKAHNPAWAARHMQLAQEVEALAARLGRSEKGIVPGRKLRSATRPHPMLVTIPVASLVLVVGLFSESLRTSAAQVKNSGDAEVPFILASVTSPSVHYVQFVDGVDLPDSCYIRLGSTDADLVLVGPFPTMTFRRQSLVTQHAISSERRERATSIVPTASARFLHGRRCYPKIERLSR